MPFNKSVLFLISAACLGLGATLALSGCGRDEIKVYQVPKERLASPATASMPDSVSQQARSTLSFTTPEGWIAIPPGEMRVASFNVKTKENKQADVSVIPLSGAAGGDFNNVNRWRAQVGLDAIGPEEMKKLAQPIEVAGQAADLYEFSGQNSSSGDPMRILAVIQHRGGTAWFFKMTGDDELVALQKAAFISFMRSCKFELDAAALPPDHPPIGGTALPPDHPEISTASAVATSRPSSEGNPKWTVPADWKEVPGGDFLVAKFTVGGEGGAQAAVNISRSGGDGGGLAANVNRWRKQLGLEEISPDEIAQVATTIETSGGKASLIEMSGTDARSGQPASLVGAMTSQSGQTWFYKLMGDAKVVENQKDAFTKFIQRAKY